MNQPPSSPPKYAWPKYVLAAVVLFVIICVTWTAREVKRLKRIKEASQDLRPLSTPPAVPPAKTNPSPDDLR